MMFGSATSSGVGVDHHRGVDIVEEAALDEADLAAAALLGRRAQQRQLEAQLIGQRRQRQRSTQAGGADDVVAAGMADAGQRVVLGADGDVQRARAELADDRGGHVAVATLGLEAGRLERVGQPGGSLLLLVAELGVLVDAVRELDEPGVGSLERGSRRAVGVSVMRASLRRAARGDGLRHGCPRQRARSRSVAVPLRSVEPLLLVAQLACRSSRSRGSRSWPAG